MKNLVYRNSKTLTPKRINMLANTCLELAGSLGNPSFFFPRVSVLRAQRSNEGPGRRGTKGEVACIRDVT